MTEKEYVKDVFYGDFPFRIVMRISDGECSQPLQLNELTEDELLEIEMACKALRVHTWGSKKRIITDWARADWLVGKSENIPDVDNFDIERS